MDMFIRGDVLLDAKRKIMDALRKIPREQRAYVCSMALADLEEEEEMRRVRMLRRI